ncbi:MAG: autotransporter domain-containing protein [Desulfovibrio sp.]|nr:autotransporter domain-containing protein [Desulfovibrio sp.]
MLTKGAIGNLINRYRAVLTKCRLLNVFGTLAVAGMLVMGGAGVVNAAFENITESGENSALSYDGKSEGALSIKGSSSIDVTLKNGTTFRNNSTSPSGMNSDAEGKEHLGGGAIFSSGANLIIDSSEFTKNISTDAGGAILFTTPWSRDSQVTLTVNGCNFSENETGLYGAGIYVGKANTVINNVTFERNTVTTGTNSDYGTGGALYGTAQSEITVNGGKFDYNSSKGSGGAIRADGKLTVSGVEFTNNTSGNNGGAISTALTTTSVTISDSKFTNNSASDDGGDGGAVYMGTNAGKLVLSGKNEFSNNTANGKSNDILNNSQMTVKDGTTELLSGYQQEYYKNYATPALTVAETGQLAVDGEGMTLNAGSVTVEEGGALGHGTDIAGLQAALEEAEANGVSTTGGAYVGKATLDLEKASLAVGNGATASNAGDVDFAADSAMLVDQTALNGAAAFTGVKNADVDGAAVHVQNAVAGQELKIFEGVTDPSGVTADPTVTGTENASISTDNSMVSIDASDLATGTIKTAVGDVGAALPGLSSELGTLVTGLYAAGQNDANAPQRGRAFVSRLTHKDYMLADPKGAVATMESAARIAAVSAVPQMTWAAQKAANAAVTQRTSIAAPSSAGLQAVAADGSVQTGAAAGDGLKNGFAMWIIPLYQSWNAWGLEGGGLDMDVNGALGGLAVGADYTFEHAFRAGITVNMGGGYAEGSGDFNKTTNDFTFWGLGAYLGWSKDNFGLTADINHTWVYNDVEQDLPAAMKMDQLKSDITSRALSAGLRGEYRLETEALDITPHVGVRYTYLTTDKYDVESNGTVMEGDAIHQGIWTFPIGVAFSRDVQMENGWYVKPSLDVAVIPAAGDIKARGDVRFTGVPGSAEVSTQTMDYVSYMGQAGVEFGNDNVRLGVNYNLQMGAQSTAHGVFGTLRYEF